MAAGAGDFDQHGLPTKNSPGRTGAQSHCTTKLVQAPHYLVYTVCADGARRPRGRSRPRHLNTALRTKMPMPMSKSSTTTMKMDSTIMEEDEKAPGITGGELVGV